VPNVTRFAPAALLAVGCALIFGAREQQKMAPRAKMATVQVAAPGYAARDTIISDEEQKVAGMNDYVLRFFRRDTTDAGFSVYVGYYEYQVQGKSIHSPKNCLPGAGWEALNAGVRQLDVNGTPQPVNRYLLSNKGLQALVYYWYQGRGRVEANEYHVKWNLMRDAALYGRTEEALVRIVVPIDPREMKARGEKSVYASADSLATGVAGSLIPAVEKALPASPATN